ncbi:MAG: ribosomal RNA small subunit methyltransferase A [Phycisphaeraceae bacterium]|nr:ribosomal RNA small subunit methyltransferase A [Phycisphaeraceae bacterium]
MQTLGEIRELLAAHGLAPRHALGQNFLIDHNLIRRLVDRAGVGAGDVVLEVGPGTGTLTEELLARGCEVVACELDRGLAALLRGRLGVDARFTLVEGDCLAGKRSLNRDLVDALDGRRFALVANLPYGAASPLISTLLLEHRGCAGMWVTIQREVAEKLAAAPGSKAYGPLSVLVWATCEVSSVATLPPECFWPRPDVTSAMVELRRLERARCEAVAGLLEFCRVVFGQRRKQLGSLLGRDGPWIEGVSATSRAEGLTPEQILRLWQARQMG